MSLIEGHEIGKGLVGFGFGQRDWMKAKWPKDPTIGNIEADVFDPATWKTEYPNPAFNQMDAADAFWAASILSRFSGGMIKAIVEEGRLSHPGAAAYLADVMIKRRDKTVRWGITQTNPLDRFEIREGATSGASGGASPELTFDNAAVRLRLIPQEPDYRIRWASFDNRTGTTQFVTEEATTGERRTSVPRDAWGRPDAAGLRYAVASIATIERKRSRTGQSRSS